MTSTESTIVHDSASAAVGQSATHQRSTRAVGALSVIAFIGVWWLMTDGTELIGSNLLASPWTVARTIVDLTIHPFAGYTLPEHVAASMERWGFGYAAAVLLGVPIGAIFAWYADARSAVSPIFETLRYIPPFAWIPIAILWFGPSLTAQALVVFIAAFPPCVINTHRGLSTIDPVLFQAAKTVGSGRLATLLHVAVPTGTPAIASGLRIAVSNGWMALIGAELIAAPSGLGFLISRGRWNGAPEIIMSGMVMIGVVGVLMDIIIILLMKPLLRWRKGIESGDR